MQFSADYQTQLHEGTHEMHESTKTEIITLNTNIQKIENTQTQLAESLQLLTQQIEEQYQLAIQTKQAEADEWAKLQEDAKEQTISLSTLQETTSQTLNGTAQALQGMSSLSRGGGALGVVSTKASGLRDTFEGMKGLKSLFRPSSTKSPEPSVSNRPNGAPRDSSSYRSRSSNQQNRTGYGRGATTRRTLPPNPYVQSQGEGSARPRTLELSTMSSVSNSPAIRPPLPSRGISKLAKTKSKALSLEDTNENRPPLPARPLQRPQPRQKPQFLQNFPPTLHQVASTSPSTSAPTKREKINSSPSVDQVPRPNPLLPIRPTSRDRLITRGIDPFPSFELVAMPSIELPTFAKTLNPHLRVTPSSTQIPRQSGKIPTKIVRENPKDLSFKDKIQLFNCHYAPSDLKAL
jgi:uncharacterized phage infection (PIP) family protein YhgE